jgi:hypothetical protein
MKMLPLKLDGGTNSGKQGISLGPSLFPDARLVHCVFGVFLGLHEGSASASDFILYDKGTESTVQRGAAKQLDRSSFVRSDQCD